MARTIQQTNKRTGYINVGITALLYAKAEIAAAQRKQTINEIVAIALQRLLHEHEQEGREALFVDACYRAAEELRPCPKRHEFFQMMGWH